MGSAHNFDLIQSNIGDKPGEIYNKLLEGEYSQILAPHLVNRVHYLLVSEKVWKTLKKIYGGYPEFRRVGIYPINVFTRTVKIYSKFEDRLDYSEQFEESC